MNRAGFALPSFPQLVRKLRRWYRIPSRDVEDVAQEVWILLWKNAERVAAAQCPPAYLAELLRNAARAYARRASGRGEILLAVDEGAHPAACVSPEARAITLRAWAVVESFIAQIDERWRDIFVEHELPSTAVSAAVSGWRRA